jgi:sirohydrochlorin cobaltochelatase
MSNLALILAGHGSHISPNTAEVVWRYVDQLRQWAVADEITACFWKEEPSFSHVLDTVSADTIVIVPVFTAQGYFTQTVIPTEMGLAKQRVNPSSTPTKHTITHKNGKTIYYTPTIGEHPYLETIVQERVTETLSNSNLNPNETAVAIIGHGTRRNRNSRGATRYQANLIRERNLVAEVVDVYLDDAPDIPSLYQSTHTKNIVAVPLFLAEGSHVTIDVPKALGIQYGNHPDTVNGRNIYYTPPVGTDDAICRVILELACDTGLPFERHVIQSSNVSVGVGLSSTPTKPRDTLNVWSGFPKSGLDNFTQALESSELLIFGQVTVTGKKVGHTDEASNTSALSSPEELRNFMREDPFRSLATSNDLPTGWHVDVECIDQAYAVVETIYPSVITDWANVQNNTFITESLEDIGKRQIGMFKNIHQIEPTVIQNVAESVCGRCTRQPSWLNRHHSDNANLPCKSPCNTWLSIAKEMGVATLRFERVERQRKNHDDRFI